MNDTFLPGSGFDTYESQDKVLMQMDGSTEAAVAVRILQQQGFAVVGAVVRLAPEQAEAAQRAKKAAEALGIECILLNAEALAQQPEAAGVFPAFLPDKVNFFARLPAGKFTQAALLFAVGRDGGIQNGALAYLTHDLRPLPHVSETARKPLRCSRRRHALPHPAQALKARQTLLPPHAPFPFRHRLWQTPESPAPAARRPHGS